MKSGGEKHQKDFDNDAYHFSSSDSENEDITFEVLNFQNSRSRSSRISSFFGLSRLHNVYSGRKNNEREECVQLLSKPKERAENHSLNGETSSFVLKQRHINEKSNQLNRDLRQSLTDYISYEVQPGDTLPSIALRYGCSVASLKRCNNLINDNELHALRTVKLPVKKYGILSEVLVQRRNSNESTPTKTNPVTVNVGFGQHLNGIDTKDFLTKMDKDLERIRNVTQTVIETSAVHMLPFEEVITVRKDTRLLSCDGADCGINYYNLLIVVFVACFVIPVIYVIYVSEET